MSISISDDDRRWLEEQASRHASSVDAVIAELIDDARATLDIDAKLLEGLAGPTAEPMSSADWERLHRRVSDRTVSATAD